MLLCFKSWRAKKAGKHQFTVCAKLDQKMAPSLHISVKTDSEHPVQQHTAVSYNTLTIHRAIVGVLLHLINEKTTWRLQNEASVGVETAVLMWIREHLTAEAQGCGDGDDMRCLCVLHVTMWVGDAAEVSQVMRRFSFFSLYSYEIQNVSIFAWQ